MGAPKTNEKGKVTGWGLDTGQQISLGFSAIGDVLDFFSSIDAAKTARSKYQFQSWVSRQNAMTLGLQAQDIVRAGFEEQNKMKEEGLAVKGKQTVAMGASGFSVGSKSYQRMLEQTDRRIEYNAATIRENTMSSYANAKYQQRMAEIQGQLYTKSAKASKASYGSLISAGLKGATLAYFGG